MKDGRGNVFESRRWISIERNGMSKRRTMISKNSLFERITENPVVIRGQLARIVQHPAENLPNFLGNPQCLDMNAYPRESKETTQ